jgi:hypothetical protein
MHESLGGCEPLRQPTQRRSNPVRRPSALFVAIDSSTALRTSYRRLTRGPAGGPRSHAGRRPAAATGIAHEEGVLIQA